MRRIICLIVMICLVTPVIGSIAIAADYYLAPNDQLEVKLIGQKDLDTKQSIAPDGTISLPAVGRIKVESLTLRQLDDYLIAEYSKYIEKPNIVVYLTEKPDFWPARRSSESPTKL